MDSESIVSQTKLFIATPCYGGMCTDRYTFSLFHLSTYLNKLGIPKMLVMSANESLITRARNRMVKLFLDSEATHLFFIDADISFKPEDVLKLILHNKPVVAGIYPSKKVDLNNLVGRKIYSLNEIQKEVSQYVINLTPEHRQLLRDNPDTKVEIETIDGLVEVQDAGTGFMMIKRQVIEDMIKAYPETAYEHEEDRSTWHALFDCIIDDNRYLSEDYTFCRRWQKMGGKIFIDPSIVLDHTGTYTFTGKRLFEEA
jgi:hypothetical protein